MPDRARWTSSVAVPDECHTVASALILLTIEPRTPADQQKLAQALQVLGAEDGDLHVRPGAEPRCIVIGAVSEEHLEQIVDRLKREFNIAASVGRPMVAYLETLTRSAEGSAKYVKVTPGQSEYAHVSVRVHPAKAGSGCSIEDTAIGEPIPKRFMPAIESAIRESMANGVLNGYPMVDIRVELHDGSYHESDSSDATFRTAAAMAFQDAAKKAEPVVLEPIMLVTVMSDERHVQAVLEDLVRRRGAIHTRAREGDQEVLTAFVPLTELFGFERQLRTETHSYASSSTRFAYYQPVVQGPPNDDDRSSRVGAPRRPESNPRISAVSVPEPDDTEMDA